MKLVRVSCVCHTYVVIVLFGHVVDTFLLLMSEGVFQGVRSICTTYPSSLSERHLPVFKGRVGIVAEFVPLRFEFNGVVFAMMIRLHD